MSRSFSKGKQVMKICQYKKSRSSLFILDKRKGRTFYLKDIWQILRVKVIIFTFLGKVATVDMNCTFARLNLTAISLTGKFCRLFAP